MKEQLKKLSDLKENEYVYCESPKESRRVFGQPIAFGIIRDKLGEGFTLENLVTLGSFVICNSKDIADYEPPVPVRPDRRQIVLSNVRGVCDVIDAKVWNQLNDYADHLEKELKEVKSKAFIPFKVKCVNKAGIMGITENREYSVLTDIDNLYCIINDNTEVEIYRSELFTKID